MSPETDAQKFSIYVKGIACDVIASHGENRSVRVSSVCERYAAIMADACPAMPMAEWKAVCSALDGYPLVNIDPSLLWARVADFADPGFDADGNPACDVEALSEEIRAMPLASKVAIIEVAEKMRSQENGGHDCTALRLAGARILSSPEQDEGDDDNPFGNG